MDCNKEETAITIFSPLPSPRKPSEGIMQIEFPKDSEDVPSVSDPPPRSDFLNPGVVEVTGAMTIPELLGNSGEHMRSCPLFPGQPRKNTGNETSADTNSPGLVCTCVDLHKVIVCPERPEHVQLEMDPQITTRSLSTNEQPEATEDTSRPPTLFLTRRSIERRAQQHNIRHLLRADSDTTRIDNDSIEKKLKEPKEASTSGQ